MKKIIVIILISFSVIGTIHAQENNATRIPLLGEKTPEFKVKTTTGMLNFPQDYFNKWKILFSHPADFTPVCSSEILELAAMQEEFDKLNAKLMVLSTDGLGSHLAWIQSLEQIPYPDDKTVKINFPLIPDPDLSISRKFGMLHSYTSSTRDVRGVFIIDPNDKIAAIFFYPMNVGRNIEEIKRTLEALQTVEKYDVLTPANWEPGEKVLVHSPTTQQEAEKMMKNKRSNLTYLAWYMWFKAL